MSTTGHGVVFSTEDVFVAKLVPFSGAAGLSSQAFTFFSFSDMVQTIKLKMNLGLSDV